MWTCDCHCNFLIKKPGGNENRNKRLRRDIETWKTPFDINSSLRYVWITITGAGGDDEPAH